MQREKEEGDQITTCTCMDGMRWNDADEALEPMWRSDWLIYTPCSVVRGCHVCVSHGVHAIGQWSQDCRDCAWRYTQCSVSFLYHKLFVNIRCRMYCIYYTWCKRFNVDQRFVEIRTISQWSSVSRLIERGPPILFVENILIPSFNERNPCLQDHPFWYNFFISIMFEHVCTKFRTFQKAIVDPFEMLLDTSLFQIMGLMIFFVDFSHVWTMKSSVLNHVLGIKVWFFMQWRLAWLQEMPACAIDDALTPIQ